MNKKFGLKVQNSFHWNSTEGDYGSLKKISKMQARRMSSINKKTVDAVIHTCINYQFDFVVSASRHGELQTSVELINQILEKEIPSPMKFAQSTHNAVSGLICIQTQTRVPVTSISAGEDTVQMGLLSAVNYLESFPGKKVLFVFNEGGVPHLYSDKILNKNEELFIAILETGNEYSISMNSREFPI